jgi:hypothetical protein
MPEKTATGHCRRMTMDGLSSGGQDCDAVGQDGVVHHLVARAGSPKQRLYVQRICK